MLTHVYWIGGGPGAGKSTIARRLAAGCGLHLYDTDEAMADHARRSTPEDSPELRVVGDGGASRVGAEARNGARLVHIS